MPESVINLYERKRGLILVMGPTEYLHQHKKGSMRPVPLTVWRLLKSCMQTAIIQLFYEGRIDREMAIQFAQDPDGMQQKVM